MREEEYEDRELSTEEREGLVLVMVKRHNMIVYLALLMIIVALIDNTVPEGYFDEEPISDSAPRDTVIVDSIVNGVDVVSGLVVDDNWELIKNTCTYCHSGMLVTQNRASREDWKKMIVWMQETQELWELGPAEDPILDYLAKHYGEIEYNDSTARIRDPLENIEWYELEEE